MPSFLFFITTNRIHLTQNEFFKKYGRIEKVVISKRSVPSSGSNSSVGIYVTFARKEDAAKAIEGMNGMEYDGKTLRYVNQQYVYNKLFNKRMKIGLHTEQRNTVHTI